MPSSEDVQIIKIELPEPHPAQQQILDSTARFKVVNCGRRFGKSLLAQIIAINKMLAGEQIAYVTPIFSLAQFFFAEILKLIPQEVIASTNKSGLFIELITGGSLQFFSNENLNNVRSRAFHYIICDESAFCDNLSIEWDASLRPTLSDYGKDAGALFISTPRGRGFFHSLYLRGVNKEPEWESFHFDSLANPNFSKEEWDAAKASMPKAVFEQEYEALEMANAANPFGEEYIQANTLKELSSGSTVVFGIDLARFGDFNVVIGLNEQGEQTYFEKWNHTPWEITIDRIKRLPPQIKKVIDSTGAGQPIVEQLQNTMQNLEGFQFTASSKPQVLYELIKAVEVGTCKFIEPVAKEMQTMEYKYSAQGQLSFAAQTGFHDDCVMALAMANHFRPIAVGNRNWRLYR